MSGNPKVMAVVTGVVAAWLIYGRLTASEAPSPALAILQYVLIAAALVGFVGAIRQIVAGDR